MGRNLLQAGFVLHVFDLDPSAVDALVTQGAISGASARDVASAAEVTLTSLPTSGTFVDVARDILPLFIDGKVLIDTGTTEVPETRRIAAAIREQGGDFLDAPVSGGGSGAEAGTLAVMVGGNGETVERCRDILETIGGTVGHLGDAGAGQLGKAVNQIAMGVGLAAFTEAMFLGVQAGLDPERIWGTLASAGAAATSFEGAARQVIDGRIEKQDFKLRELPYFIAQAKAAGIVLPLTEALSRFASVGEDRTTDPLGIPTPSFWYELWHRERED